MQNKTVDNADISSVIRCKNQDLAAAEIVNHLKTGMHVSKLALNWQQRLDFVLDDKLITQSAPSEFQLQQMTEILRARLIARSIDARCLDFGDIETNLAGARQKITIKQGIERELAKKIQAAIKDAKLKVDSQINGDKLRVTGKKRDDLQAAMALLRGQTFEQPLQFDNFRD